MPKSNEFHILGALYLGTNNLQLTVAQVSVNGELVILEDLVKPTMIGSDAFSMGRIAVSTMHETVAALHGFRQLLKDYGVKTYRAVSTSAFREAGNREYILDHIRTSTGFEVEVINRAQERYFMYKALRYQTPWIGLSEESFLVVNIASGGVELSVYERGVLSLMEYINIGSLRLHEMLSGLQNKTWDFSRVMEEFVHSRLSFVTPLMKKASIKYLVGLGSDINMISSLCGLSDARSATRADIARIYDMIRNMPAGELTEAYGLSSRQAETLLPAVIILNSFLTLTETGQINVPGIELRHGILYDLADSLYGSPRQGDYYRDIIGSVWYIADKYGLELKHSEYVSKMALSIFDQTSKLHRLGPGERRYLEIAAILHTIGYFVNYAEQYKLSYELVRNQIIMGLSDDELDIIANIVFYHGSEVPDRHHEHYSRLSYEDKMTISKLSAILKLADSLDLSRGEKIKTLEIALHKNTVDFTIQVKEPTPLEEWAFGQNTRFFEEVFGTKPNLKPKG